MGITQSVLAERLGVTQGAVAHWLSGRRSPDVPTLERILKALDLAPLGIRLVAVDDAFDGQSNVAPMLQPSRKPRSYPLISWVAAG
ncbi:helix-turn-helix domain-containing protein, partial [Pseudomonas aeruginosa]